MVGVGQHRVATVETLRDSICARNPFQSLFALRLSLSKDCSASWSSTRLALPRLASAYSTSLLDYNRTVSLRVPCFPHQPSPAESRPPAVSTLHCWAPQTLAQVSGASVGSLPLHLPTEPHHPPAPQTRCPPTGEGEAAGVDANQRSQPRTAVAPRLTHSPKLNTHYTKLIDIN